MQFCFYICTNIYRSMIEELIQTARSVISIIRRYVATNTFFQIEKQTDVSLTSKND